MDRKLPPKYSGFELIRFPLIFGTFLLAAGTAFYFRESIFPLTSNELKNKTRGSEEDRVILRDAMNKSKQL